MFRIKFNRNTKPTEKELLMSVESKLDQIIENQAAAIAPVDISTLATAAEVSALSTAVAAIGTQLTALAGVVGTEAAAAVAAAA